MNYKKNKGVTLIEVIIYIALFSILMGGAFVTAYQMIDGSSKLGVKNTVQEEGNFVLRKINWALTGVKTITIPSSGISNSLEVIKYDGNRIKISTIGDKIKITESVGSMDDLLTTDNVSVSDLDFQYISPTGDAPAGITAIFKMTVNGVDFPFTTTKYIRK